MLPEISDPLLPGWQLAQEGFELYLTNRNRAAGTIANRVSNFTKMARWASRDNLEPDQITKKWMTHYLNAQYKDRVGTGKVNLFMALAVFWRWWAKDEEKPSPMAKLDAPGGNERAVPVLTDSQVDALLAAARGSARDYAMLCMLAGSGLRRFELAGLD